jgi:ATP-dependent Clp protease protease subunit
MWALIDIMINAKSPIYTYCTGYAMSAGFQIFLAGSKRFVSNHSSLLYHQMSCWRSGKYQDLVEDREEMDYLQNTIEGYVQSRTKITDKKLKEIREKKIGWYIHKDEALELGIATDVIEGSN